MLKRTKERDINLALLRNINSLKEELISHFGELFQYFFVLINNPFQILVVLFLQFLQ